MNARASLRVLHVTPSIDPTGGGPVEAIRQMGLELRRLGHEVDVLSLDGADEPYVREFPLPVHTVGPTDAAQGGYGFSSRLVPWLRRRASGYDAIVVNGLWQYHGVGTWRALHSMGAPYFVYVHGMLDPWFKFTYPLKHLKKAVYWQLAEYRVLRDARAVLFTSEEERLLARQSFSRYRARERVVAFGTGHPQLPADEAREAFLSAFPRLRGKPLLLFLGRIHEKKGCDLLIHAFSRVAADAPDLHLVMAGPDTQKWTAILRSLARRLGVAARICWTGMLRGELKWGALHAAEAFVLPSHQENFGVAVAEALGCGKPVLISNRINIWREVQEHGAGLVEEDTLRGTEGLLRRWLDLTREQRDLMGQAARACFEQRFTASAMARDLLRVIQESRV